MDVSICDDGVGFRSDENANGFGIVGMRERAELLGGAFAVATYTGCWRNTKDLDLYVLPEHKDRMIAMLGDLGLVDYFPTSTSLSPKTS